jgi:hypothetical protein
MFARRTHEHRPLRNRRAVRFHWALSRETDRERCEGETWCPREAGGTYALRKKKGKKQPHVRTGASQMLCWHCCQDVLALLPSPRSPSRFPRVLT